MRSLQFETISQKSTSKFGGDIGILERKHVVVTDIKHIGKEMDDLTEPFGLDEYSYEFYMIQKEPIESLKKILDRVFVFRTQRCHRVCNQQNNSVG